MNKAQAKNTEGISNTLTHRLGARLQEVGLNKS